LSAAACRKKSASNSPKGHQTYASQVVPARKHKSVRRTSW